MAVKSFIKVPDEILTDSNATLCHILAEVELLGRKFVSIGNAGYDNDDFIKARITVEVYTDPADNDVFEVTDTGALRIVKSSNK